MTEQKKKIILAAAIFLLVVLLGGATVWLVYTQGGLKMFSQKDQAAGSQSSGSIFKGQAAQPADADGDGLTDEEEKELGTNSYKEDTDGDSLFDLEETKVYMTDPLNADTDGDGVSDGDEIRKGDDPKGPGKLLDLPASIEKINSK